MTERPVALFLVDETNEFQQLLRADAEAAAARAGLPLETTFTGIDFAAQISMVQRRLDSGVPPLALLVMCVTDRGLQRVAQHAARAGVHFVLLNATQDDLDSVRIANPGVAVTVVCPDEVETGRLQGRQFRRLLPHGGRVLYVQGRVRSEAARDRTAGVLAAIEGTPIDLVQLEAGWTADDGREAAGVWLRMALRVKRNLDLIGCQNDMIAQGVLQAMASVAAEISRPEIRSIPVTGCDGSPEMGQTMVRRGDLRATVVLPRSTAPAIELVARVMRGGELPPPLTLLKPTSFPDVEDLEPGSSGGTARPSPAPGTHLWSR